MKYILSILFSLYISILTAFAAPITSNVITSHDAIKDRTWDLIGIFTFIESFLLKVALPLVVVWAFLYIAWELLTAEGNEEKMKKAWKAVTYSAIGLLMIALAYAIVAMASRLSL